MQVTKFPSSNECSVQVIVLFMLNTRCDLTIPQLYKNICCKPKSVNETSQIIKDTITLMCGK